MRAGRKKKRRLRKERGGRARRSEDGQTLPPGRNKSGEKETHWRACSDPHPASFPASPDCHPRWQPAAAVHLVLGAWKAGRSPGKSELGKGEGVTDRRQRLPQKRCGVDGRCEAPRAGVLCGEGALLRGTRGAFPRSSPDRPGNRKASVPLVCRLYERDLSLPVPSYFLMPLSL